MERELEPEIGVATVMEGNLKKFLKRVTMAGTLIVYGILLLLEFRMFLVVLDTIEKMFRQI